MKRKHILSLILSFLLLVSFTVPVFAETETETSELQIDMNEGRQLWNEYLKQLEPYKNDETIYDEKMALTFPEAEKTFSERYGTKKEFLEKSQHEKLMWLPTLFPARYCPKVSDPYDWTSWERFTEVLSGNFKKRFENESLANSCYSLMQWHFEYYVEVKNIFDFVGTFGTEIGENVPEISTDNSAEDISNLENSKEILLPSKAPTESKEELSADVSEVASDIASDVSTEKDDNGFSSSNLVLCSIIVVLAGIIVGLVIYTVKRKKSQ